MSRRAPLWIEYKSFERAGPQRASFNGLMERMDAEQEEEPGRENSEFPGRKARLGIAVLFEEFEKGRFDSINLMQKVLEPWCSVHIIPVSNMVSSCKIMAVSHKVHSRKHPTCKDDNESMYVIQKWK